MKHELSDLIDIPKLQNLTDMFLSATGTALAIFDARGKILIRSGWCRMCADFHRTNPETEARCSESDAYILQHLGETKGEGVITYKCKNGLMDAASLLFIDGEHAGTIFIGQFFSEKPDVEYFRAQAREFGFNEAAYVKALEEVPVLSGQKVASIVRYLKQLTEFLADIGRKELKRLEGESALRESEERFRAIADYTYGWEAWVGDDGKLLWVNSAVERITGYSVDECLAMPDFLLSMVDDTDREKVAQQIEGAIRRSSNNDFEFRVLHKDGRPVWVAASWQPISNSRRASLGHRFSFRDIAKRRQMEEELRRHRDHLEELVEDRTRELALLNQTLKKSEERFRFLVQQVKDYAIIYLDIEGRVVSWNEGAEQIYRYRPEEVLGKHFSIFHAKEAIEHKDPWRMIDLAAGEGQFKGEGWRVRKDGSRFWADVVITALHDEDGRLQGFTAVTRNIDERRKAEDALSYRLAMEELVVTISNRFINIPSEELDVEIGRALDAVRSFTAADRSYLGLLSNGFTVTDLYESLSTGVQSRAQMLKALPLQSLPWLLDRLKKGEAVILSDIADLPAEAIAEKEYWRAISPVRALVVIPMILGQSLRGYLALNSDQEGKRWVLEDVNLLKTVGEIFGTCLERRQTEKKHRELELNHHRLKPVGSKEPMI